MSLDEATRTKIAETIQSHDVVLFMKGRRRMPQCGFSAQVVGILDQLLEDYSTVNVLTDPQIREGIKAYANWPTIPQLYVKGEFVGGCDIITEMFEQGQLQTMLGVEMPEVKAPTLSVSEGAAKAFSEALKDEAPSAAIRLTIDARFRATMGVDGAGPLDMVVEAGGLRFVVDRGTAQRSDGLKIDFIDGPQGGFRLDNPNEPPKVRNLGPGELAERMRSGELSRVYDVRTADERAKAHIEGTELLDETVRETIMGLPKDTPIAFHCHHGGRSQAAAEYFLGEGFTQVYNLAGGIDAWSREVNADVPRY